MTTEQIEIVVWAAQIIATSAAVLTLFVAASVGMLFQINESLKRNIRER